MSKYPTPVGWRILIKPTEVKTMSDGGIALPESSVKDMEYLQYTGEVVAMGSDCYKHPKFGGCRDWCKVGDTIAFGQYSGQKIVVHSEGKDEVLKCINDDEVIAVCNKDNLKVV